jgi:hypothetical protein
VSTVNFDKTTQEIYNISPALLGTLPYPEALRLKLLGVKSRYKETAKQLFDSYRLNVAYPKIALLSQKLSYLSKAEILTKLQLSEIDNESTDIIELPTTEDIYGVSGSYLKHYTYKEALEIKFFGVREKVMAANTKLFDLYRQEVSYDVISEQTKICNYLTKAEKLTKFQLEELNMTQGV